MIPTNTIFLNALVPVFFGLALGYYAGRRKRIDNKNVTALNVTLMHFLLPCSLFLAVGRTPRTVLQSESSLLAVLVLVMAVTYAIVYSVERSLLRQPSSEAAVQALTVSFANNVAVGLPLLSILYGPSGLLAVAAAILAGVLVISPVTLVLLECSVVSHSTASTTWLQRLGPALLATLRRPVVLAPLCALGFPLTGHILPAAAVQTLDLTGKATIGVALFLTGLILSAQPLRIPLGAAFGVLLKNIVQPAIMFLLLLLFHLHGDIARQAFLISAIPAGFFGTVFGARYGVSSPDASSTLVLSTVLSIVTLPIAIALSAFIK